MLLYGPPGTGKTLLAAAVAHEAGAQLFDLSPAATAGKYSKEAATMVHMVRPASGCRRGYANAAASTQCAAIVAVQGCRPNVQHSSEARSCCPRTPQVFKAARALAPSVVLVEDVDQVGGGGGPLACWCCWGLGTGVGVALVVAAATHHLIPPTHPPTTTLCPPQVFVSDKTRAKALAPPGGEPPNRIRKHLVAEAGVLGPGDGVLVLCTSAAPHGCVKKDERALRTFVQRYIQLPLPDYGGRLAQLAAFAQVRCIGATWPGRCACRRPACPCPGPCPARPTAAAATGPACSARGSSWMAAFRCWPA